MSIKCFMIEPIPDEARMKDRGDGRFLILKWRRPDTGEEHGNVGDFGPGAMYYAVWLEDRIKGGALAAAEQRQWVHAGPDGRVLGVVTPGGEWIIDSRASNCTLKDDNEHACWVRHGTPPMVTVDKAGKTCEAGAGSIQCGSYHGFLRNGELTQ
jgi:hypothetical protein